MSYLDVSQSKLRLFAGARHLALISFLLFQWQALAFVQDNSNSFRFFNLGDTITMSSGSEQNRWRLAGFNQHKSLTVILSERLLVKTAADVNKAEVNKRLSRLCGCETSIQQLYVSPLFHYYLVSYPAATTALGQMVQVEKLPQILLVQPDILQQAAEPITQQSVRQMANIWPRKTKFHIDSSGAKVQPEIGNKNLVSINLSKVLQLEKYWARTRGENVSIAVIDDGFMLGHTDLSHIRLLFSYDADHQILDAQPKTAADRHGTQLLGLIMGQHNQQGPDGIAPAANLIAIRQTRQWTSQTLLALSLAERAGADIINCSWHSEQLMEPVADVINDIAASGRNGLGLPVVIAAGNRGKRLAENETESSIAAAIVVGTLHPSGRIAKFSNYGPAVDVFFPGVALLTTGKQGSYTRVSGTSFSAALVSGYLALLMAQDKNITLKKINQNLTEINWNIGNIHERK